MKISGEDVYLVEGSNYAVFQMTYKEGGVNMCVEERILKKAVQEAIERFYLNDHYLIDSNVHERTITFRLGLYLQHIFISWDVDCECNKNIETIKKNKLLSCRCKKGFKCGNCTDCRSCTVFPDIIIHKRETKNNLLVIEAKCNATPEKREEDIDKLKAYLEERSLRYQYGLFIDFKPSLNETLRGLYWLPKGKRSRG